MIMLFLQLSTETRWGVQILGEKEGFPKQRQDFKEVLPGQVWVQYVMEGSLLRLTASAFPWLWCSVLSLGYESFMEP